MERKIHWSRSLVHVIPIRSGNTRKRLAGMELPVSTGTSEVVVILVLVLHVAIGYADWVCMTTTAVMGMVRRNHVYR